jgi:surfeit locus 1 family protein
VPRKLIPFVVLAVILGALFVRLGVWQLSRLAERRAANRKLASQLSLPPSPLADVLGTPVPTNRRARVEGVPDYDQEFVVTGRSRNGSPGVHILTPVRVPGSDTAVLVNRGWAYAADAASTDLPRWREERTSFSGYTQELSAGAATSVRGRGLRPLTRDGVRQLVTYPVHAVYLVAQDSGGATAPVRLAAPALDEGPHLSYAIQWFAFAAIALGGTLAVIVRSRGGARSALSEGGTKGQGKA